MNISLPPELTNFVKRNIKARRYQNASQITAAALRLLQQQEQLQLGDFAEVDVEALAFIVLMQATKDMDADLKMIMAEVKAMTAAKAKLRDLIGRVRADIMANAKRPRSNHLLGFSSDGIGSEQAYHRAPMPVPDPGAKSCVKVVPTDLHQGRINDIEILEAIQDDLKAKLDSMSDMTELSMLRLQMMMDRRSKFISTLSNMMKKISSTQDTLIQNLK